MEEVNEAFESAAAATQSFGAMWARIDPEMAEHQQAVRAALRAQAFELRGLQPCCGATNPHCDSRWPHMTSTGCARCGHAKSCHHKARR